MERHSMTPAHGLILVTAVTLLLGTSLAHAAVVGTGVTSNSRDVVILTEGPFIIDPDEHFLNVHSTTKETPFGTSSLGALRSTSSTAPSNGGGGSGGAGGQSTRQELPPDTDVYGTFDAMGVGNFDRTGPRPVDQTPFQVPNSQLASLIRQQLPSVKERLHGDTPPTSAIPIPPAGVLFGSALIAMLFLQRRRRETGSSEVTPDARGSRQERSLDLGFTGQGHRAER